MSRCNTVSPVRIISQIWILWKLPLLTCSPTNTCTILSTKLDFCRAIIHCFLPMPHYNTTAPLQNLSLKWNFEKLLLVTYSPTKACFAVLHVKGWISPTVHCFWWLASYNLTMHMTSCMIPLARSEVAWYNGYSLTKVPHSCDFQWRIDHVRFQSISFSTFWLFGLPTGFWNAKLLACTPKL